MGWARYLAGAVCGTVLLGMATGALAQAADPNRPADPVRQGLYGPLDAYPESPLYSKPVKVAEGVWSSIGATQPPTMENAGHNNNLSFIVGETSVLVVNGGASTQLAEALHAEIKQVTSLPVTHVIAENGQGHAMLGMGYWKAQGAQIIAHEDAVAAFAEEEDALVQRMDQYLPAGTSAFVPFAADVTFADKHTVDLGNLTVEAVRFGPAHSPGDVSVIVPARNVVIAGDMAFHVRIPPIFKDTDTKAWLESWELFAATARTMIIVPGHGGPTGFDAVDAGTRGYLEYLRGKVAEVLEKGGTLQDAYEIDQTPYRDSHTYWELAARNAGHVYEMMEFE